MKRLIAATFMAFAVQMPAPVLAQSEPFLGQVTFFPYNFCPRGWTEANGEILPIASYTALFSLMGTNFAGDGRTTFGIPDLRKDDNPYKTWRYCIALQGIYPSRN